MLPSVPSAGGLGPRRDSLTVSGVIAAWLDSKLSRSNSIRTIHEYAVTIEQFRAFCRGHDCDLAAPQADGRLAVDTEKITVMAQAFAKLPNHKNVAQVKPVAAATHNQRLAIISSLYTFAHKRRYFALAYNPIDAVDRAKVQAYRGAKAKTPDEVGVALAAIDRSALKGLRDYAILSLALYTGRRVSELAALQRRDIEASGNQGGTILVHWRRVKGGESASDELPTALSQVLRDYSVAAFTVLTPLDRPFWLSFKPGNQPLGSQAIQNLCETYLGTSKAHVLRHTFAMSMLRVGATGRQIQERLGHKNLATTMQYLEALESAKNSKGGELLIAFGIAPMSQL